MGVKSMSKIKVHELAKKIGINSKELVEKANELGINVKSHLSTLEDSDAKKLEESFGKVKKEVTEKTSGPVIIRRQVIMNEEEEKINKPKQERVQKKDVGFVERDRKKDYNIVYRNKPTKPMSVSELFGISKKEEPKEELKPEIKKEKVVVETPKPQTKEIVEEKNVEESVEKKENNMKQEENNNYNNRPFNKERRNNNNSFGNQNNHQYFFQKTYLQLFHHHLVNIHNLNP